MLKFLETAQTFLKTKFLKTLLLNSNKTPDFGEKLGKLF